jgi:hypothetical protein
LHTSVNVASAFVPIVPSAAGSTLPLNLLVALLYVAGVVVVVAFGPNKLSRERRDAR